MLLELKDVISIAAKRCTIKEMCLEMVQGFAHSDDYLQTSIYVSNK